MKITLQTKHDELVGEHEIPDFDVPPEVVQWSGRTFRLRSYDNRVVLYREATAHTIP